MRREGLQGAASREGDNVAFADHAGDRGRSETPRCRARVGSRRFDHDRLDEAESPAKLRLEVGPAGIVIGDGYPDDTAFAGEGEEAGDLGLRDPRETCDLGLPEAVGVIKPGQQPELVV